MKHYMDYLPNYLGGSNIEAHCHIMDSSNRYLNQIMNELSLWNNLERPILIERNATTATDITMNIHINVPSPIKKIIIIGDYTYTQEYSEEDLIQTDYISFETTLTPGTLSNPDFIVSVETYDEVIYMKAYPENDEVKDNVYDHDEFLDKIGVLMGVPRRIYMSYPLFNGALAEPPYFGKITETSSGQTIVQSCTEDDYYYCQRIKYFMENYQKKTLPELMLYVRYHYTDIRIMNASQRVNDPNLTERLETLYQNNTDKFRAGTYLIIIPDSNPVNIQNLTSEKKEEFISLYCPMTRSTSIIEPISTNITTTLESNPYEHVLLFHITLKDNDEDILESLPITYDIDGEQQGTVTSDDPYAEILLNNLARGTHQLNEFFHGFYEYSPVTTSFTFKTLLDESLSQSSTWQALMTVDPTSQSILSPITIENGQLQSTHPYGSVLYTGHQFDITQPHSNIKIVVRTGFYYNIGFQDENGLHKELHVKGSARSGPVETFRLYNDGTILRNGFPTSKDKWPDQTYHLWVDTGFNQSEQCSLFIENQAGHTPNSMIVESIEHSQFDSVPFPLVDTQDGKDIYMPNVLFNYVTLGESPETIHNPSISSQERTWQIDISSTETITFGFGTMDSPRKYQYSTNTNGQRKKYHLKIINGKIYVFDCDTYTGTVFTPPQNEVLYLFLELPSNAYVLYDVAYAPVVTEMQSITPPQPESVEFENIKFYQEHNSIDYTIDQSIIVDFSTTSEDVLFGLGSVIIERDNYIMGNPITNVELSGYSVDVFYDWEGIVDPTDGENHTLEFRIENGTIYAYLDGEEPSNSDYASYTPQQDEELYLCRQTPSDCDLELSWHIQY